ncbi:TPA: phage major capsid protein [Enterococcus faecalis]
MKKNQLMKMKLQMFATPTFNPDNVTMQTAKTGEIPKGSADAILTEVKQGSSIMRLAKQVTMSKPIEEFTYMTGVGAYWVSEAERIQTSKPTFVKAEMRAYKMAVIIPTTRENLDYSVSNFFELMRPEVAEAFYKKFDQSAFTGVNSPFAKNILGAATTAGNVVTETANKYDDINQAIAFIEEEDLEPNGIATTRKQRVKYRSTKDGNGMPIFNTATASGVDDILGLPISYTPKTTLGAETGELVGDWNYAYYGILKGLNYEILDQATLTTVTASDGAPINLAERDMVALKATMTVGFMVVKDDAFSVVKLKAEGGTGE